MWGCGAVGEAARFAGSVCPLSYRSVSSWGFALFCAADGTVGTGALLPLVDRCGGILLGHVCVLRTAAGLPRAALPRLEGNVPK